MTAKRDYQYHVWYTRQAGKVSGPFPIGLVRRFVLLDRLSLNDEVSPDKEFWQAIRNVPEVIPEEMQGLKTEEDRMRLKLAQIHEDDRGSERELGESKPFLGRRIPEERHSPEMEEIFARREVRNKTERETKTRKNNFFSALFLGVLLTLFFGGVFYAFTLIPDKAIQKVQCDAPAAAGVNWSYCKKEGLVFINKNFDGSILNTTDMHGSNFRGTSFKKGNLSYAILTSSDLSYTNFQQAILVGASLGSTDLSFSRLNGADMSYANLRNANLEGASLEGAKLGNAIWVDGTVCAEGSVGNCIVGANP
jgi:uncharacterized protein YjbI with pentapeptide repeats